jgi:hypothetical protein
MRTASSSRAFEALRTGAVAGLAGGLAEIGWVASYGTITGTPTGAVARGVAATVVAEFATSPAAVWLGIGIHLILAVGLGVGLAIVIRLLARWAERDRSEFGVVMPVLAAVWAANFLIALP